MSNLVRGSRFSVTLFKTGQSSSVNACKHWNCNCYPSGTLNIQRTTPNVLSASWQSTGKCFFLVGGRACKSFSHKAKEDVHGFEIITLLSIRRVRQKTKQLGNLSFSWATFAYAHEYQH